MAEYLLNLDANSGELLVVLQSTGSRGQYAWVVEYLSADQVACLTCTSNRVGWQE